MKNITYLGLEYGEKKTMKLRGKYIRAIARAVEGNKLTLAPDAEIILISEDETTCSDKITIELFYAEYGSMSEYVFFDIMSYISSNDVSDVISFNYVRDGSTKTAVVIIAEKH